MLTSAPIGTNQREVKRVNKRGEPSLKSKPKTITNSLQEGEEKW